MLKETLKVDFWNPIRVFSLLLVILYIFSAFLLCKRGIYDGDMRESFLWNFPTLIPLKFSVTGVLLPKEGNKEIEERESELLEWRILDRLAVNTGVRTPATQMSHVMLSGGTRSSLSEKVGN